MPSITRNMLLLAGFPLLLLVNAAAAADDAFTNAMFNPDRPEGTLPLTVDVKSLSPGQAKLVQHPATKRGTMRFEARGTPVATADAPIPPAFAQRTGLERRQDAPAADLGPDAGSLFSYSGASIIGKPAMRQSLDMKPTKNNPSIFNYRDVNQKVIGKTDWKSVQTDLEGGPELSYHYSLHLALNDTAEGYADGIRKIFDPAVLPPVTTPPQGEPQDYNMFPDFSSKPMTMLLYPHGKADTISYAMQATAGPPALAVTTFAPIPLAIAIFVYCRQVVTALVEGVGRPEVALTWQEAATAWASIVALRSLFDITLMMLKDQKVSYPIKSGDFDSTQVPASIAYVESGKLHQTSATGTSDGAFEAYTDLKNAAETST